MQPENQADKGVVRPAAEGEDTAPQAAPYFTVERGNRRFPNAARRAAMKSRDARDARHFEARKGRLVLPRMTMIDRFQRLCAMPF